MKLHWTRNPVQDLPLRIIQHFTGDKYMKGAYLDALMLDSSNA